MPSFKDLPPQLWRLRARDDLPCRSSASLQKECKAQWEPGDVTSVSLLPRPTHAQLQNIDRIHFPILECMWLQSHFQTTHTFQTTWFSPIPPESTGKTIDAWLGVVRARSTTQSYGYGKLIHLGISVSSADPVHLSFKWNNSLLYIKVPWNNMEHLVCTDGVLYVNYHF